MPKVTFGIITLNGAPLLEYNLQALYPFAHQIIVVEGAIDTAAVLARDDGHSQDGTLEMLHAFKAQHDPQNKIVIVTAADEGYQTYWPEKNEMSQAYAKRTTGDWLWQVDGDEFYHADDMKKVFDLLDERPEITAISFPYYEFWGGFDTYSRGWWYDYEHPAFHRLFKWGTGYQYLEHRPPTVIDEQASDTRSQTWLNHQDMKRMGVYLYHYSYVFPKQAEFKVKYYSTAKWTDAFRENQRWLEESYYGLKSLFFIGEIRNRWQWLQRFDGEHPIVIQKLRENLQSGQLDEPLRKTQDIEQRVSSVWYRMTIMLLLPLLLFYWRTRKLIKPLTRSLRQIFTGKR